MLYFPVIPNQVSSPVCLGLRQLATLGIINLLYVH